jgi:(1->4)-alpha-D-glucan 1-alpha-D-glucosylmutase
MTINVPYVELWDEVLEKSRAKRDIPVATYRLQMNKDFTFCQARDLVAYLHALGISHAYASPYFKARAESTHGYDIANHNELNPSIGSEEEYQAWVAELHARGMGQVLDIVPNHMGIGEATNTWWLDVLENGPSSPYASFFDIDWAPIKDELENSVLLPILGDQYGRILENQELKLSYADGAFTIAYWETQLPVAPRTYAQILEPLLVEVQEVLVADDDRVLELQSIITAISHLPPRTETDPERLAERNREREIIKRRLHALVEESDIVREALGRVVEVINGVAGDPRSFDRLDELIRAQVYRLAYWRVAAEEINYRRFFDINDLAAIRMERPEVFEETHRLILRLLTEGAINALRIDHPDGLWDPAGYFAQLQKAYLLEQCRLAFLRDNPDAEEEWPQLKAVLGEHIDELARDDQQASRLRVLPVFVEKILSRTEQLPTSWLVEGTSGYDFLNSVNGLFVDSANEKAFTDLYAAFIREKINFSDLVYAQKKLVMRVSLASEINVLAHMLDRISERSRYFRDFTLNSLKDAIREVIACFSVYRTYITECEDEISRQDRAAIDGAISRAKKRNPATDPSIFDFIRGVLLLEYPAVGNESDQQDQLEWVMKFQQCTGPIMAKGLEDTAFYIYNRLISLNEVGGEPQHFGNSVAAFHRQNAERRRRWPHTMLASSTHDTKRSEDVRARINVLSEIPREWRSRLTRWSRLNRRRKPTVDGQPVPDRNEEYLLYQTLVGSWPLETMDEQAHAQYVDRIVAYMLKALREAKVNTSWLSPNVAYDEAVETFVRAILVRSSDNEFLTDLSEWSRDIAETGMVNSLSQTLLKLTSPGLPDIYQGNEVWDFSLVDPDNRRPVDYAFRARLLRCIQDRVQAGEGTSLVRDLVENRVDGGIKLYLTERVLAYRQANHELFAHGDYVPLDVNGNKADHACAFARTHQDRATLVAVTRLPRRLHGSTWAEPSDGAKWNGTTLILPDSLAQAGARFRNLLTGEDVVAVQKNGSVALHLRELFQHLPVAILERIDQSTGEAH